MKSRLHAALTVLSLAVFAAPGIARCEVFAELDPDGAYKGTRIVAGGDTPTSSVWDVTGTASSRRHVLNPDGAGRGDLRPDIAVNPMTGLPLAVWSRREGRGYDIAVSTFDGRSWSSPITIHRPSQGNDLDPRVAFRSDGLAIVTWWQNGRVPSVHMSYSVSPATGPWVDGGIISTPGERASRPSISQEGSLTIVAYRTLRDIGIATFRIASSNFGDGPTPFPRSGGNGNGGTPETEDSPVPREQ